MMSSLDRKVFIACTLEAVTARAEFSEEMEVLRDIFNDAWSENWGFVPFTKEEFMNLATDSCVYWYRMNVFRLPRWTASRRPLWWHYRILTKFLPSLTEHLFPFGWVRLLKD